MKKFVSFILLLLAVVCVNAAALPESGKCDWSNAKKIAPGIELKTFKYDKPRILSISAVKAISRKMAVRLSVRMTRMG